MSANEEEVLSSQPVMGVASPDGQATTPSAIKVPEPFPALLADELDTAEDAAPLTVGLTCGLVELQGSQDYTTPFVMEKVEPSADSSSMVSSSPPDLGVSDDGIDVVVGVNELPAASLSVAAACKTEESCGAADILEGCMVTVRHKGKTSLLKKVTSLVSDSVGKVTDTLKASDLAPLDGALKRLSSAATDSSRAALGSLSRLSAAVKKPFGRQARPSAAISSTARLKQGLNSFVGVFKCGRTQAMEAVL
eukprot:gene12424-12560_t